MTILLQITSPNRVDQTFTSSASHACGNYASDDVFTSFEADILANPTRVHLEGKLTDDDMHFTGQHLADFMAKVGSFKKKYIFLNIRKSIISVFFRSF